MTTRNLEIGDTVYFIENISIPGSNQPDEQLHRAVVSSIMKDTVELALRDERGQTQEATEFVLRSPDDVLTAEEVLETVFQSDSTGIITALEKVVRNKVYPEKPVSSEGLSEQETSAALSILEKIEARRSELAQQDFGFREELLGITEDRILISVDNVTYFDRLTKDYAVRVVPLMGYSEEAELPEQFKPNLADWRSVPGDSVTQLIMGGRSYMDTQFGSINFDSGVYSFRGQRIIPLTDIQQLESVK